MDIRTKFNLGDIVFYIDNGKIQQATVVSIETTSILYSHTKKDGEVFRLEKHNVIYNLSSAPRKKWYEENQIFATEEELLATLKNKKAL
jgi:hypothetical protein